jgi:hypothetical protein
MINRKPSEIQKRNRRLFLEYFSKEFSNFFAIDLEEELLKQDSFSNEFSQSYERKIVRDRAKGYLAYFDGINALERICLKHKIRFDLETTNGKNGGEYGLAKTENFFLAYSNNPNVSQKRTIYQSKFASLNGELGLQQGELDFEDTIKKVANDDERFYVTVGLKKFSKKPASLVFHVPNTDGYSMYAFYIEELIEVFNELKDDKSKRRLDEVDSIVTLRQEIKKGNL